MNSAKWNEIVRSCKEGKIYHTYEWSTLLMESYGYKVFRLSDGETLFPLALVNSFIFGNRLLSLPFSDYGGPCANVIDDVRTLLSQSDGLAQELRVDFLEIRAPDKRYFDDFTALGFLRRDDYFTFILPLQEKLEELWKGIGDKNRNMVRKAERNSVQVVNGESQADLRIFYKLYLKTMKKLGSPPEPYEFFSRLWDVFYPENLLLPMAVYQGKYIAAGIFFLHNRSIHHAYGCSLREYLALSPNDLIQWHIIQWGHENGWEYLDFGRTRKDAGNWLFKKRWGGEPVAMPYFYKFYKRELKQRQEIEYKWISNLWRQFMPEFIAKRVGPWIIEKVG